MPQPARNPAEVLPAYLMFSCMASAGFLYTLHPNDVQKTADTLSKVWSDPSSSAAMEEAKQLSNEVLDTVLQSQLSTFFLGTLVMSVYALAALVTKVVFLGSLTVIEFNKLTERLLMFVLLKVVFFGAVVNPTYRDVGTWMTWFCVMGYLKMFVGLAGDRCEALLSSPRSTPLQHLRCLALLGGILVHVGGWMAEHVASTRGEQARLSSAALWLFDGATVVVEATHGIIKYSVHALERWRALRAEKRGEDGAGPWEWQGTFLYHLELGADLLLHCLTMAHYLHLWTVLGLRFQLVDFILFLDVRYLAVVIWHRLRGYRRYRRLTGLVQDSFPDAQPRQLADCECAICMERMAAAKVLPCRHVFHLACLRAWLQQSRSGKFSCPMCRADLNSLLAAGGGGGGGGAGGEAPPGALQGAGRSWRHEAMAAAAAGTPATAGDDGEQQGAAQGGLEEGPGVEPVGALLAALAASLGGQRLGGARAAAAGQHLGEAASDGAGAAWSAGEEFDAAAFREFWAGLEGYAVAGPGAPGDPASALPDAGGRGSSPPLRHGSPAGSARGGRARPSPAPSGGPQPGSAGTEGELSDAATGPLRRLQPQHPSSSPGGQGPAGVAAGAGFASALAASLAAQSLRTAGRAVSELARSASRGGQAHGGGSEVAGGEGEEGVVDQPVAFLPRQQHTPEPRGHRYPTRSKSRLA